MLDLPRACGVVAVLAIGFGARALFGAPSRDEVDRAARARPGGMAGWTSQARLDRPIAPPGGSRASPALLRPFARLAEAHRRRGAVARSTGRCMHAGYRAENAVEIFLGVKLLLPPLAIIGAVADRFTIWTTPMEFAAGDRRRVHRQRR